MGRFAWLGHVGCWHEPAFLGAQTSATLSETLRLLANSSLWSNAIWTNSDHARRFFGIIGIFFKLLALRRVSKAWQKNTFDVKEFIKSDALLAEHLQLNRLVQFPRMLAELVKWNPGISLWQRSNTNKNHPLADSESFGESFNRGNRGFPMGWVCFLLWLPFDPSFEVQWLCDATLPADTKKKS